MTTEPDEMVGWYELPTWVKGGCDRSDESLSYWRGLSWFRSADRSTFFAFAPTGRQQGQFSKE